MAEMMARFDFAGTRLDEALKEQLFGGKPVPWSLATYVITIAYVI
jgi:hypothetical protein